MTNKMRSIFKAGIILMLTLACLTSRAQQAESIQASFEQYNNHVLKEKIYVHTDKSFYLCGELLWFKLYNVDAATNKPLNLSKVAYAEVLDADNTPVLQAKVALDNAMGNGSFYLPVTLKNGNYKLRAYTNLMKNFGPDSFFEKQITIVNTLTAPEVTASLTPKPVSVQFFAEGGSLLNGVANTISFKATGSDGKGIDITGVVINQRNDTVARFVTQRFGMGSFELKPDANSSYKAIMRTGKADALIVDLPQVLTKGYALHLINAIGPLAQLEISERGNTGALYVFVHHGGTVVLAQSVNTDANGHAAVTIDRSKLGKGINHITLFNSNRQPVCERLIFNRPDLLELQATVLPEYKLRSAVSVPVTARTKTGAPLAANLSVSVYKLDSLTQTDEAGIAAYLWLTADLKGNVESANYYFENTDAAADAALDNLMLVQGWSKFKWDDVLNAKQKFTYLPELEGHLITGKVTGHTNQPVPNIPVFIGIPGKRVQLYTSTTDSAGNLLFITKQLFGPGEIVVQTNIEKDSTAYNIAINSPFASGFSTNKLSGFKLDYRWQQSLKDNNLSMQVQNAYVSDRFKQYLNPMVDSAAFYGSLYKQYLLDDFTRFKTMEEVLREYVAEMTVSRRQKRIHFNVLSPDNAFLDGDPLVMLDGVPVFNLDKVFTIDPLKIRKLDMVNRQFYWGPSTFTGIVNFTSYQGDMAGFEIDPKAIVLDYEGMQFQREFYSPVYDTNEQKNSRLPDFRNVLYWAPNVNINQKGNAEISFYTSDNPGKYLLLFQGLTTDGQAGRFVRTFEVKK